MLKKLFIVESERTAGKAKRELEPLDEAIPVDRLGEEGGEDINHRFMEVLLKSLEERNIEGFDYLEFKQSLRSLDRMELDEEKRFKTAYTMASTMGVSKEYLKETARHYLNTLKREEEKFQAALRKQKSANITGVHNEMSKVDEALKVKNLEMEDLRQQIERLQGKRLELQELLESNKSKIIATEKEFVITWRHLVSQIEEDIKKIDSYLK